VAARLADAILEGKVNTSSDAQAAAEGADVDKGGPKARANVAKRAAPRPPKT
jgi:hypothetical protein